MLGSINPLGERGRGSRWGITTSSFLLASTAAGAVLGAVLGGLGGFLLDPLALAPAARIWILVALIAVGIALDLRPARRLPGPRRQVDDGWLYRYRGWVYGVGFGFQLGLGAATIVVISAVYIALAAALLSGSALAGSWIGGAFGLARAATVLSVATVRSPLQLARVDARLRSWDIPSRRWSIALEAALLTAAFAGALS